MCNTFSRVWIDWVWLPILLVDKTNKNVSLWGVSIYVWACSLFTVPPRAYLLSKAWWHSSQDLTTSLRSVRSTWHPKQNIPNNGLIDDRGTHPYDAYWRRKDLLSAAEAWRKGSPVMVQNPCRQPRQSLPHSRKLPRAVPLVRGASVSRSLPMNVADMTPPPCSCAALSSYRAPPKPCYVANDNFL